MISIQVPNPDIALDTMTEEDIKEEFRILSLRVSRLDSRRHAIRDWVHAKDQDKKARALFDRLPPDEQRALIQIALERA